MSKTKRVLIVIAAILVLIQFIEPAKNNGSAVGEADISHVVSIPADVDKILVNSCYDCHSNHTEYPWYSYIQPVEGWLAHHVNEGKEELNFSEFKNYKLKRQAHKLEELVKEIEEGEMPLSSYTTIHKNAILSNEDKMKLVTWAKAKEAILRDSLNATGKN